MQDRVLKESIFCSFMISKGVDADRFAKRLQKAREWSRITYGHGPRDMVTEYQSEIVYRRRFFPFTSFETSLTGLKAGFARLAPLKPARDNRGSPINAIPDKLMVCSAGKEGFCMFSDLVPLDREFEVEGAEAPTASLSVGYHVSPWRCSVVKRDRGVITRSFFSKSPSLDPIYFFGERGPRLAFEDEKELGILQRGLPVGMKIFEAHCHDLGWPAPWEKDFVSFISKLRLFIFPPHPQFKYLTSEACNKWLRSAPDWESASDAELVEVAQLRCEMVARAENFGKIKTALWRDFCESLNREIRAQGVSDYFLLALLNEGVQRTGAKEQDIRLDNPDDATPLEHFEDYYSESVDGERLPKIAAEIVGRDTQNTVYTVVKFEKRRREEGPFSIAFHRDWLIPSVVRLGQDLDRGVTTEYLVNRADYQ